MTRRMNVTRGTPSTFQIGLQRVQHRHVIFVQAKCFPKIVVPIVVPTIELVVFFVSFEVLELAVGSAAVFLVLSVLPLPGFHPSEGTRPFFSDF